jgi:hypothetical protein
LATIEICQILPNFGTHRSMQRLFFVPEWSFLTLQPIDVIFLQFIENHIAL